VKQIKQNVALIAGGAVLLAGLALLALLGLTVVVIPAVLAILIFELRRAIRCVGRAPALFWRMDRTTKNQVT